MVQLQETPPSILNLSNFKLNHIHCEVLQRGLSFAITHCREDLSGLDKALDIYRYRSQWRAFFENDCDNRQQRTQRFRVRNNDADRDLRSPPLGTYPLSNDLIHEALTNYINRFRNSMDTNNSNLSAPQRKALDSLKRIRNEIIFKKADKGNTIVLMDRNEYLKECHDQLNKATHYCRVDELSIDQCRNKILSVLEKLSKTKMITAKLFKQLLPPREIKPRVFYLLPKIHKPLSKWASRTRPPGRPILSNLRTESYPISQFLDYHLQPHFKRLPTYIGDTLDFLDKVRDIRVTEMDYLVTMDVTSLYTNIPHNLIRTVLANLWDMNPDPINEYLSDILDLILDHNDFSFEGRNYRQICGVAMGNAVSPTIASLVFGHIEQQVLAKCKFKPTLMVRFLDDIFLIWPYSISDLEQFVTLFNSQYDMIQLTMNYHRENIDFLDVELFKGNRWNREGYLDTKVHFKPENSLTLLHYESGHPRSTFRGILLGQLTRYARICSDLPTFLEASSKLMRALKERGYPKKLLTDTIGLVKHRFFSNNTVYTAPCEQPMCNLCRFVAAPPSLLRNKHPIQLEESTSCSSGHVIYCIWCKTCEGVFYIGRALSLRDRLCNHLSTIRRGGDSPLSKHFNALEHRNLSQSFAFTVIDKVNPDITDVNSSLIRLENKWIKSTKAVSKGLNVENPIEFPIPFTGPVGTLSEKVVRRMSQLSYIWNGPWVSTDKDPHYKRIPLAPNVNDTIARAIVRSKLEERDLTPPHPKGIEDKRL